MVSYVNLLAEVSCVDSHMSFSVPSIEKDSLVQYQDNGTLNGLPAHGAGGLICQRGVSSTLDQLWAVKRWDRVQCIWFLKAIFYLHFNCHCHCRWLTENERRNGNK